MAYARCIVSVLVATNVHVQCDCVKAGARAAHVADELREPTAAVNRLRCYVYWVCHDGRMA